MSLYAVKRTGAQMSPSDQLNDSVKLTMGRFLLLDADMALLFIQLARNSPDSVIKDRRLKAAAKAYDRIIAFIPRAALAPAEMALLSRKLSVVQSHLKIRSSDVSH